MAALPLDIKRRHTKIEAGQFVAERFALCGDKEPSSRILRRLSSPSDSRAAPGAGALRRGGPGGAGGCAPEVPAQNAV